MDFLPSYLDELDKLLLQLPDDCMLLSSLDGFLTGVLVSPDMIPPSRWLKVVWGGETGEGPSPFDEVEDVQRLLDLVMHHYNSILRSLNHPGEFEPIFDIDTRTDETLWEIWIDGFAQAMRLAPEGWQRVSASGDPACDAALAGIETLRACASGEKRLTPKEQGEWDRQAPDLIPIWVEVA